MPDGQLVLVSRKIGSGAFSGERVFQLPMAAGGDYIGIAPVGHCFDANRNRIGRDQPGAGIEIDGFVEAYLIANGGAEARIELPDGEAIAVPVAQVRFQRESNQVATYVPLGS